MDPTDRAIKGFYCIFIFFRSGLDMEMVQVAKTLPHGTLESNLHIQLAPGRCGSNLKSVIFKLTSWFDSWASTYTKTLLLIFGFCCKPSLTCELEVALRDS